MAAYFECVFCSPLSDCLPLLNQVDLVNLKCMIILEINGVGYGGFVFFFYFIEKSLETTVYDKSQCVCVC